MECRNTIATKPTVWTEMDEDMTKKSRDPLYVFLEFAARHHSSDYPEHCSEIVRRARFLLSGPPPIRKPDPRDALALSRLEELRIGFSPYSLRRLSESLWKPGPILDTFYSHANAWENYGEYVQSLTLNDPPSSQSTDLWSKPYPHFF